MPKIGTKNISDMAEIISDRTMWMGYGVLFLQPAVCEDHPEEHLKPENH